MKTCKRIVGIAVSGVFFLGFGVAAQAADIQPVQKTPICIVDGKIYQGTCEEIAKLLKRYDQFLPKPHQTIK